MSSESLDVAIRGDVITRDGPGYDTARMVYNAMHASRPLAVVRPVDDADVMTAVRHARSREVPLAVRGGGHSVPGYGTVDDGIVIDLSRLRNVRVDVDARRVRVGGGAVLGDLDHATHAYGLATPLGFASTTGVAGLTLGGGISPYLGRRFGMACDNLASADVITADGERVTASHDQNPDLFWALRGGGGNFGVVTSMEFILHPVSSVVGGPIFFDIGAAGEVLRFYREFLASAPRELGGFIGFHLAPPLPFIPENRHGRPHIVVVVCWSGDAADAATVIDPIRAAGSVVAQHVESIPYPRLQSAFDALVPAGLYNYWKSDFVETLTDDAIDVHTEYGSLVPSVNSTMHLYPMDGAVQDVGQDDTAFSHRQADLAMTIVGMWPDPVQTASHLEWVRDYHQAVHRHSGYEGGYSNFASGDDPRVRDNYGTAYERLASVKATWDPDNVFRLNQNIAPSKG